MRDEERHRDMRKGKERKEGEWDSERKMKRGRKEERKEDRHRDMR